MITLSRQILSLLDATGRRELFWLLAAMLAAGALEVVGIGSIIPLTSLLIDPDLAQRSPMMVRMAHMLGINDQQNFKLALGLVTLGLIVLANAINVVALWLLLRFTWLQGHRLSERLLASYLKRPYGWVLGRNTSDMMNAIFTENVRVVGSVLIPALTIVARAVTCIFVLAFMIALEPVTAISAMALLGGAYAGMFLLLRKKVSVYSQRARDQRQLAHRAASEALGGFKDVKLYGLTDFMMARFAGPSSGAAGNEARNQMMASAPRYMIELLAFGGFVLIALFLPGSSGGSAAPTLAAFAFAGYRLMPAVQQMYASFTVLTHNRVSLNSLLTEIADETAVAAEAKSEADFDEGAIRLSNVGFRYPGREQWVLRNTQLVIPPRTSVAIVGLTGAGKTTLVDMILGLLEPTEGEIAIGERVLTSKNIAQWQRLIGYVPQTPYFTDDTIAANIAFGIASELVDMAAVEHAAELASLRVTVERDMPKGYATMVGERGSRLSNGQRQRLGIARALYRNPKLLVLDEATNALDYGTETAVLEAIERLSHRLTIIMIAHRRHTIEACDEVYEVADGLLRRMEKKQLQAGGLVP